jgi:hypothetical protein
MEKIIYPSKDIGDPSWHTKPPVDISTDVLRSLDGIAAKVLDDEREVFLDKDFGFVWCFSSRDSFKSSLLSRIHDKGWKPLSFLAEHPDAQSIISDLRTAYNSNPVKFIHFEYQNPFYDPCVIGDMIFSIDPQKSIGIYLAVEGGDKMAHAFDDVLKKYNVKI